MNLRSPSSAIIGSSSSRASKSDKIDARKLAELLRGGFLRPVYHGEQDDDICLELAHSIRVVLTELADRISQVLKDQVELTDAVSRLLNKKPKKESGSIEPVADTEPAS